MEDFVWFVVAVRAYSGPREDTWNAGTRNTTFVVKQDRLKVETIFLARTVPWSAGPEIAPIWP
eukprot:1042134-Prymnesium_polylepis.1